jgi:hypothetical protein
MMIMMIKMVMVKIIAIIILEATQQGADNYAK